VTHTIDHVGSAGTLGRADTGTPARLPDALGFVERDGVRVHWESYGDREPAILLMPTWSINHSRVWKANVPYLARHFRVLTYDGRGNGLSDRPDYSSAYDASEYADDAAAVMDAAGVQSAVVAGVSLGALYTLYLAARHPGRVAGALLIAPTVPLMLPGQPWRNVYSWSEELDTHEGWAKFNRQYWLRDWPGFAEFFCNHIFSEPHSTKQIEDSVSFALDTDPETMVVVQGSAVGYTDAAGPEALCRGIGCPVVVAHGTDDQIVPFAWGERVAELTNGEFVRLEHTGHGPQAREPVFVNGLLRGLAERVAGRPPASRARARSLSRPKRALYVSSPIGLGHAWRDVTIADELRRRVPGLEIHWLAQHPVTTVLRERGETIHPLSAELASEAEHIDREAGEHDLHAFQALRRMDEVLCANFMVFSDLVRDETYDVWIADEGWEIDHFLHENPELKTAPYAWLSDFVGFLPMAAGGEREAFLTADYNAEMIEHIERFPSLRDVSIYVGDPADLVPGTFGDGLPEIRDWTERHYEFAGYIPGFDPQSIADRGALREALGYGDEPVCVVSVGGSGVGAPLLHRVIEALPLARERVPGLRTVVVTGPRIDPAELPQADGLEVHGYVHELYRHLAACDVGVVQGGLTTTMELVAAGRPFISVPLASHFEQRFHVRHRLNRYGATNWIDYEDADPETLADAIAGAIATEPAYLPVDGAGAGRAAGLIAALL
jgi:pimeloyl-ACP methyl ester carboxylesterase/predicted glycosyltransferase